MEKEYCSADTSFLYGMLDKKRWGVTKGNYYLITNITSVEEDPLRYSLTPSRSRTMVKYIDDNGKEQEVSVSWNPSSNGFIRFATLEYILDG